MTIFADNRRHSKYAAICFGGGLLGVLVGRASWWIGLPIAVLFFTMALFLMLSALTQSPRITVGEEGIGGAALPRRFTWTEIASIEHATRSARYRTMHVLRITPEDGEPFDISLSDLLTPPTAIVEEVERFHSVD